MKAKLILSTFGILMAITVTVVLITKISSYSSGEEFKARYYAEDLALLFDRIGTTEKNVLVNYYFDMGYDVKFEKNKIVILKKGVPAEKYDFIDLGNIKTEKLNGSIILKKEGENE